jgi:hypothetical protein
MKLEVGMYVRFDYHRVTVPIQIGKITEVHYDEDEKYYFYSTDNALVIGEDNLVKEPSHNIIDLIEVGDYVNGWKVLYWTDGTKIVDDGYATDLNKMDIKSIVTKEQFSAMEYKID